jgi:hypothetical protein
MLKEVVAYFTFYPRICVDRLTTKKLSQDGQFLDQIRECVVLDTKQN